MSDQYKSVFVDPRPEWTVSEPKDFFYNTEMDGLDDIHFTEDDMEKACAELKADSAPGADGIPIKELSNRD